MDNKVIINYSKIFDTLKVLNVLEDVVSSVDFSIHFEDMESYFREINMEHDNCIQYKKYLDNIFYDLKMMRDKMVELNHSLSQSSLSFINKEELTSDRFDKLLTLFPNIDFKNQLTTELENPCPYPTDTEQEEFNAVPIGVAIGATGVAGAIGAVVVDAIYNPKGKKSSKKIDSIEDYQSDEDYSYTTPVSQESSTDSLLEEDDNGSYSAVRDSRNADQYYGDQWNSGEDDLENYKPTLKEVEPSKTIDLTLEDEDDSDEEEDFY